MSFLKNHIFPTLHNAIGGLVTAGVVGILAVLVTFRSALMEIATLSVPFWALMTLVALLAIFFVIRHHRLKSSVIVQPPTARYFLNENDFPSEIASLLRGATTAVFWGTAFSKFIPSLRDDLEACLKRGLYARFLLIKPNGAALKMANFRGRPEDASNRNGDLLRNLTTLKTLAKATPPGTLKHKVVDYLAPYAMVIFDEHIQTGRMFVWLATLGVPNKSRPMFELSKANDPEWFSFFANQFRLTWEKAIDPPQS